MTRLPKILAATVAVTAAATIAVGLADAAKPADNDAVIIREARTSLIEAVQTAERHIGGKATRAELEAGRQGPKFEIEVVGADGRTHDVEVDALRNTVIASVEDRADREDRRDAED